MLYELKNIRSYAANAENPKGAPSMGGVMGGGHKGCPCVQWVKPSQVVTLLDVEGSGVVRHIWLTFPPYHPDLYRGLVIRMYWDGQEAPSVEAPVGDFFGVAHARYRQYSSSLMSVQSSNGLNSWIPMPFKKSARITVENDSDRTFSVLFYQVDFTLGDTHPDDLGYFHAQFRRSNCHPFHSDYVILDGVLGKGRYLGTVLGVRSVCLKEQWWGEGEVKMYFDGEKDPTICGTGAEDYVGCAWGLSECFAPHGGCTVCDNDNKMYSFYRWHDADPIYFESSFKITVMQMGYGDKERAREALGESFVSYPAAGGDDSVCYYDRSDDYCSTAFWYQTLPTAPFPPFPGREERLCDLPEEKNTAERNDI
ncbi:MAG: DUF2961 domain-containing protein [Clostridia bacterium]|nr:DUF2961 domain-containing protein [Clostridia bacterium]